jgi:nucleoside-diphosphate-sugar epimerase
MTAIVTGATGCLGMALVKRLCQQGVEVVALARNKSLGRRLQDFGAHFIAIDLSEKERLEHLCQNANIIYHLAALSSPWGRYCDFYQSNVLGTANIIAATPTNARLIYVSSPSIYFDFTSRYNIKESSTLPKINANHYIQSKKMAEQLIDYAVSHSDLKAITIRPRGIFGPYDRALFPRIIKSYDQGRFPLIGNGEQLVDITYVDNVVESLLLAAHANACYIGQKYNITNDEPKPFIEIICMLFNALSLPVHFKKVNPVVAKTLAQILALIYKLPSIKSEPRLTPYTVGVMSLGQTLDISKAKSELAYKPLINIEQGLERFACQRDTLC